MRRAALRRFATVLLLGSASLGCRERTSCTNCGTLVSVVTTDADILVAAFTQTALSQQAGDLVFLKLADVGLGLNTLGDSGFVPRLARSWKFEDSLTLAFALDPRARWQDGQPVTASDVAFTFDIYSDPKAASPARSLLTQIMSVTARDEHTALFRFRRRYPEQFYDATHHMRILPKHLLDSIPHERLATSPFNRNPVGNGPFRLASWKSGESIEFVADTGFFLGRPGLNRVIWRVSPDFSSAITQLTSGEADFMEYLGSPENVARVAAVPSFRVQRYVSPAYIYLGFNLRGPLFQDRELRRALSHAVDRQTIVTAVMGDYGSVALGPLSRMIPAGNDSTLPQLAFDTTAAGSALDRLGWQRGADGIRSRSGRKLAFEILVPNSSQVRKRMAVILQDQFKRVGVAVTIGEVEFNLFNTRTRTGKFEAAIMTWNDDPTPSSIRQIWTTGADANTLGYRNPRFDRLVDQAQFAPDPATSQARWKEALATVNDDAPAVWIACPIQPAGIHRRYENVTIRPDQWTATLWTWRVTPGSTIERDRVTAPASR